MQPSVASTEYLKGVSVAFTSHNNTPANVVGSPALAQNVFCNGGYRYGFNGQERDDEVSCAGNLLTSMYWQYDARLGRGWNIDPVVKEWESPYAAFGSNPVWFVDPNGDDTLKVNRDGLSEVNLREFEITAERIENVNSKASFATAFASSLTAALEAGIDNDIKTPLQYAQRGANGRVISPEELSKLKEIELKGLEKVIKGVGTALVIVSSGIAWKDAYGNRSTDNVSQAIVSTGLVLVRVNPLISAVFAGSDLTGLSDKVVDKAGEAIDKMKR